MGCVFEGRAYGTLEGQRTVFVQTKLKACLEACDVLNKVLLVK